MATMVSPAEFTVIGAASRMTYLRGASVDQATREVWSNGFGEEREVSRMIRELEIGATWKTHEGAHGLDITRTA